MLRHLSGGVHRAETVQLLQRLGDERVVRRVEELEAADIGDAEHFEVQNRRLQVCPLYLRDRIGLHVVVEQSGVQTEALPGLCSPRTSRALRGGGFADGDDFETVESRDMDLLLDVSRVDDVNDPVDCQ